MVRRWEKIINYKIQITNKFQIANYNVQNYKLNGIHASMPYHSRSPLFPSFLSSQIPSFPLYPLAAGGKGKNNGKRIKYDEASGTHYSQ
jgi:hypothetical protein